MSLALLEQVVGDLELSVDGGEIARLFAVADQLLAQAFTVLDAFDSGGLWDIDGAVSLPAWFVTHAGRSRPEAFVLTRTLRRLRELPVTFEALRTGVLTHAQVQVIVANVSDRNVGAFVDAETELVPLLAPLSIAELTTAMRAWAARAHAAAVAAANADPNLPGEPVRVHSQKMADALVEMARMIIQGFKTSGRRSAEMVVVMTLNDLNHNVGQTPSGTVFDQATIQTMMCDANIAPILLGHRNEPLHYGSGKDFIPPGLYKRILVRDRHCRFRGCDRPGIWSEVHHLKHRANGGPTDITNLALFCSRHHHLLHKKGWDATMTSDGVLTVTTPTNNTLVSHPPGHHYHLLG